MTEAKVKGVAFKTIELCFTELRGRTARDRLEEHLPRELAEGFRYHTILATNWYPIELYKACFRAFRAVTGEGPELAREIGKLAARHDMSGVHKQILARLISPQALVGMSQRVFNTYYDTGTFAIEESRRGFIRAACRGCKGFDENMWAEIAGSCESLLEIAGAKFIRLRIVGGGGDDSDSAVFEARWA
jgi:hypothetical protein